MAEAIPNSLDLFEKNAVQSAIVDGRWVEIRPVNSIEETAPIDFRIDGSSEDFIDLSETYIKAKIRITNANGNAGYGEGNMVAPVNLILQSMWKKLDVMFNGKRVSSSSHTYPYRAYLESLLNLTSDVKKGQLSASGWFMDTAHHFNTFGEANLGFMSRQRLGRDRNVISLMGKLHADVFNQNRCLIDGVNVDIKLDRSSNEFCIMRAAEANAENYKIKLEEVSLFIRKVKVLPSCRLGIYKGLSIAPIRMPIRRTSQRDFSMPAGITTWSQEGVITGQLPRRLTIGFVGTDASNGAYHENPFNFHHFNINFFTLYINGKQLPSRALSPDFANNTTDYVRSFMQMSSGLGHAFANQDCGVSYSDFQGGNTLFVFNLNSEQTDGEHIERPQRGSVRIEVRFSQPLPRPITCIVFSEFDSLILIDKDRNPELDYSV